MIYTSMTRGGYGAQSAKTVTLTPEFPDDPSCWCMLVDGAMRPDGTGCLEAPPYSRYYFQPHCVTLWIDASGGGVLLRDGKVLAVRLLRRRWLWDAQARVRQGRPEYKRPGAAGYCLISSKLPSSS